MTRFLVATVPVPGHTHPLVPVATELVLRGHDVAWLTGRRFEDTVTATGARFEPLLAMDDGETPLLERFPERAGLEGLDGIRFDLKHVFLDSMGPGLEDLRRALATRPADLVVADAGFLGAAACHELGGPRFATVGITPLPMPSRDLAPFGTGLPPLRGFGSRLRAAAVRTMVRLATRDVQAHHRQVRASLGLAPTSADLFSSYFSPYLVLQSGTRAFDYPRPDLPSSVHYVGPLVASGADSAAPVDWAALAAGRPLVVVTQGTVATDGSELLVPAMAALAGEPVFVVAIGRCAAPPSAGNAWVVPFAPYDELFAHASAVVSNGGMGGVQAALAHGIPLVVAGTTEDKPEVAARVAWSGAGVNLRTARPNAAQLRSAVRRVLDDPSYAAAARRIRDDYATHRPGPESADLLEELVSARVLT